MSLSQLELAKSFYNEGKYYEASEICLAIQKDGSTSFEAPLLFAKAFLSMLKSPTDKEHNNTIYSAAQRASECATTVDEFFKVNHDLKDVFESWKEKTYTAATTEFMDSPHKKLSFDSWGDFCQLGLAYSEMALMLSMCTSRRDRLEPLCAAEGITSDEAYARYTWNKENDFDESVIKDMLSDFACSVVDLQKTANDRTKTVRSEVAKNVAKRGVELFSIASLIMSYCTPKEGTGQDALRVERLLKHAEILTDFLNAVAYAYGSPFSILSTEDARTSYRNEIASLYSEIKKIDKTVVMPLLPSATPIPLSSPSSTNSSSSGTSSNSGGCYVATAVYGSYDCPEVWTLRRFRDYTLAETWYGRAFIRTYYAISPTLVKWFGETEWFRNLWKPTLDRMVENLNQSGVEDTPYNDRAW